MGILSLFGISSKNEKYHEAMKQHLINFVIAFAKSKPQDMDYVIPIFDYAKLTIIEMDKNEIRKARKSGVLPELAVLNILQNFAYFELRTISPQEYLTGSDPVYNLFNQINDEKLKKSFITKKQHEENKQLGFKKHVKNPVDDLLRSVLNTPVPTPKSKNYFRNLSDKEILLLEGHPVWLDNLSFANNFWKTWIDTKKIYIGHPALREIENVKNPIIEITEGYDKNSSGDEQHFIAAVQLMFSKTDCSFTLNEALPVISNYLPKKLIQDNYMEIQSYYEPLPRDGIIVYTKGFKLLDKHVEKNRYLPNYFEVELSTDWDSKAIFAWIHETAFSQHSDVRCWNYELI